MTAQELLKPRFEVIADYPDSEFKVGEIEDRDWMKYVNGEDETDGILWKISDFPHLFRKLNWWEHRKVEDMPKKLICKAITNDKIVRIIEEWDMDLLVGWTNKAKRQCCDLRAFNPEYGYFPID